MRMYDFERVIESGATVAFSSDVVSSAELHRADPFFGMQIAATRVDPETPLDAHRWPGGERPAASAKLSVDRLLQGYTINAARQMRIDDTFGKIAAGRPAHLVVLDRDPVMTPADRLGEIVPVAVLFDGSFVHGSL